MRGPVGTWCSDFKHVGVAVLRDSGCNKVHRQLLREQHAFTAGGGGMVVMVCACVCGGGGQAALVATQAADPRLPSLSNPAPALLLACSVKMRIAVRQYANTRQIPATTSVMCAMYSAYAWSSAMCERLLKRRCSGCCERWAPCIRQGEGSCSESARGRRGWRARTYKCHSITHTV